MPYALREALSAFRRSPLLAFLSVVAIGFSLFVIGLFGLTAWNIGRAIEKVEEKVEIVAYLDDATTPAQLELAQQEVRALPGVLELRYVTKLEALASAREEMQEFRDVFSDLDNNPLPASFEIRMKPGSRTPDAVKRVSERLKAYPFVEDVRYGREWLDKIYQIRRLAGGAATMIGAAPSRWWRPSSSPPRCASPCSRGARRSASCGWWAPPTASCSARSCWKG